MFKRIEANAIPPKRGASPLTKAVHQEFEMLKKHLKDNPLGPYQAEMLCLDVKEKPASLKNAITKLYKEANAYFKAENLPYTAFTRTLDDKSTALYVMGH